MVPAVQFLLAALLASLTPPAVEAPSAVVGPAAVASVGPAEVVEALPLFRREEAGEGYADEEDEEHPARPRLTSAPVAFAAQAGPSCGAGASSHPAFHSVPRSLFLLCGRLTC